MAQRKREIHNRKSTTYRKGKERLRPMSLKQLEELADRYQKGKKFALVQSEIARKQKMGIVWNKPVDATEE